MGCIFDIHGDLFSWCLNILGVPRWYHLFIYQFFLLEKFMHIHSKVSGMTNLSALIIHFQ